ncbi:hypothetical protein [Tepidimonas sp.]|uniref:hypothetical protein n=1 Tax=Tepidimonas sp. TaxID=2002775 RepID=UPI00391B466C
MTFDLHVGATPSASLAVAWGLLPVAVRLEQDTRPLWLRAQSEPGGGLCLGLTRTAADGPLPRNDARSALPCPRAGLHGRMARLAEAARSHAPAPCDGRRWSRLRGYPTGG